jgi:hypothetical protein
MMNAVYAKGGIMGGFGNDKIRIGDDIKLLGRMPLVHHPGENWT